MAKGLTLEDRQQLMSHFIRKLEIPEKNLDNQGLQKEIEAFLKKKQCLTLATINPDGSPHVSILDYVSDGLDLYMATEGGDKLSNLEGTNKVAVSIGFSDGTVESEYGLMMDGIAKVYRAPHPKYVTGMMKLKNFVMEWSKSIQPMENVLKKAITSSLIKVTPFRMTYMNIPDGIPLMLWEHDR